MSAALLIHIQSSRETLNYEAFECLDECIALITDRNRELTDFEDLNTLATSGSSTTAMVPVAISAAKRFGLDFL